MRVNEPVFIISVAARLVEMHPQTLRKYERQGFIEPSRTMGNLRLYSDTDIERLRQVKYLVEDVGLNLAGVQLALELTHKLRSLQMVASTEDRNHAAGTGAQAQIRTEIEAMLAKLGAPVRYQ